MFVMPLKQKTTLAEPPEVEVGAVRTASFGWPSGHRKEGFVLQERLVSFQTQFLTNEMRHH